MTNKENKNETGSKKNNLAVRFTMSDPSIKKGKPKIKLTQHDLHELARQLD